MRTQEKIIVRNLCFQYEKTVVLGDVHLTAFENTITAVTGPSGQGKTTFLSVFNRLWDDIPEARVTGDVRIRLGNRWISPLGKDIPTSLLRRKVGIVFQEPNPLPMSIAKNIAFPLKLAGVRDKAVIRQKTRRALKQAFLWDEVKDRLNQSAMELSGGQKQRLCIARALVLAPEVLLCDEPTSSLDDQAADMIEKLLLERKKDCTLLVVSHDSRQVERIADQVLEIDSDD